jgi:hypothetical protein
MKFALPATLALGGLSLLIAALAAFTFYLDWISQPTLQFIGQAPSIATSVSSAQDIASLKVVCLSLAQAQDTNTALLEAQSAWFKRSLDGMASFSLGWGLVCGVAFLYVHFLLRRLSREGGAHAL